MSGNDFVKGRTDNHLTWVMVDATDFATPESALSAATKIKIYGKLRGGTGTNFVSSGTGSLTNDITHVGASALGIYTIALVKADLSDASAAWYDQYIISLSATGAAYQTLVVDGGIDTSALLSRTLLIVSGASDAASAAAQANSRVLLVQSRLSDFDSRLVSDVSDIRSLLSDFLSDFQSRVPKAVATQSKLSDVESNLLSVLGTTGVQLNASSLSDIRSAVAAVTVNLTASDISDIASAVLAGAGATALTASDMSDIASRVWAMAPATALTSRVLVVLSQASDIYSLVSDLQSDFQSRVPKLVATNSQVLLTQSLASDAHSAAAQANSRALVNQSAISDVQSLLTIVESMASDAASAAQQGSSRLLVNQSVVSDILSAVGVVDDFLDTEIAAIKAKTDNLPAAPAATGDAMTLTAGERNSVADALLNRDLSTGTDSGSTTVRTVRQALRILRNKWAIAGGTLTVYKEDDATSSWTAAATTTAGDPISTIDPAGP